jgi:O-antigen ligase
MSVSPISVRSIPGERPRLLLVSLAGVAAAMGVLAVASPLVVIAATVGLIFVAIAVESLAAGLAIFTVLTFLEAIPAVSTLGLTFTKLAGGVLAGVWLVAVAKPRSDLPLLARRLPLLAYTGLALVCWTFASMLWGFDPGTAGSTALRFAQGVVLIFVIFSAIRERRHLMWVVYAFLAGAVLSAVIGLAGTTPAERADIAASGRLAGGIGDPNELAALLVPALGIALFLMAAKKGTLPRLLLLGAAAICALGLFQTESRGGIVGLGVMLLASVALAGPVRARAVTMALAVSGLALVYFVLIAPPQILDRVTQFDTGGGSGRTDLWSVALAITENHPLAGIGAGNFTLVEPSYAFGDRNLPRFDLVVDTPLVVHNTYLNVLVELGVVGFILFGALIAGAFVVAFRAVGAFARAGDWEMEILARGLVIGTIGMLAAFFFLSAQYEKQLPLLLGILTALATLGRVGPAGRAGE